MEVDASNVEQVGTGLFPGDIFLLVVTIFIHFLLFFMLGSPIFTLYIFDLWSLRVSFGQGRWWAAGLAAAGVAVGCLSARDGHLHTG